MPKERMSLSLEVVILEMIALELLCVMVLNLLSTLSCYPAHPLPVVAIILGHNGLGNPHLINPYKPVLIESFRIFRTDYGHTEVAAHFGNGKASRRFFLLLSNHGTTRPTRILYFYQRIHFG